LAGQIIHTGGLILSGFNCYLILCAFKNMITLENRNDQLPISTFTLFFRISSFSPMKIIYVLQNF